MDAKATGICEGCCGNPTEIAARGPALPLQDISKDERYLISEMTCKTFGEVPEDANQGRELLHSALKGHTDGGGGTIQFKKLLEDFVVQASSKDQLMRSFDDVLDHDITGPTT